MSRISGPVSGRLAKTIGLLAVSAVALGACGTPTLQSVVPNTETQTQNDPNRKAAGIDGRGVRVTIVNQLGGHNRSIYVYRRLGNAGGMYPNVSMRELKNGDRTVYFTKAPELYVMLDLDTPSTVTEWKLEFHNRTLWSPYAQAKCKAPGKGWADKGDPNLGEGESATFYCDPGNGHWKVTRNADSSDYKEFEAVLLP